MKNVPLDEFRTPRGTKATPGEAKVPSGDPRTPGGTKFTPKAP